MDIKRYIAESENLTKQCSEQHGCGKLKLLSEFSVLKYKRKDGSIRIYPRFICKECKNMLDSKCVSEKYQRNLLNNPIALRISTMITESRKRAKKRQLPFNLDFDWAIVKFANTTHCPILGFQLDWTAKKTSTTSPTLDRIIPKLGYVKNNVQIVSHRANAMKQDASLKEMVMLGKWAAEHETINIIHEV